MRVFGAGEATSPPPLVPSFRLGFASLIVHFPAAAGR